MIHSSLPHDRWQPGELWVVDEPSGNITYGPVRCRGKADNQAAAAHGNPARDPQQPYGDHPYGDYRVIKVTRIGVDNESYHHYGPVFLALDPVAGDALTGKENGRTGIGIHGGPALPDGTLRATDGCLRVDDATALYLADLVGQAIGDVIYRCSVAV